MLIDALSFQLEKSGALELYWEKLDAGQDASLGIASSARPFMVAAQFVRKPQTTTLVVVAGEDAARNFARELTSYLGANRVMHFPARTDIVPGKKPRNASVCAQRAACAYSLKSGAACIVVASAAALTRKLPPATSHAFDPLVFEQGMDVSEDSQANISSFEDVVSALVERGYENTGELESQGTFAVNGGTIDVFPGNLKYPVRIDFFGDEIDEIRRIVPSTGQTVQSLERVEIFPVIEHAANHGNIRKAKQKLGAQSNTNSLYRNLLEGMEGGLCFEGADALLPFLYDDLDTLGAYLPSDALSVLIEPKSLFDDAAHASDEENVQLGGSGIAVKDLYAGPAEVNFGSTQRAHMMSLMGIGKNVDVEMPVKRADVAGAETKLFGKLRSLISGGYMVVFSAQNAQVRHDMMLLMVDNSLPIQEMLDARENSTAEAEKRRLRAGVVNIVDVDIPIGMIFPKAKLALISVADTTGSKSIVGARRNIDITEISFPYKPGDYVVHAVHGVAYFKSLVRQELDGVERDYLLLEYAEGDRLFVPVEQFDRVTRYVGPEGSKPRLTRLHTSDWSRALRKASKATKKLAFDLVDVYSRRAAVQGFRFSADTPWQQEMEDAFPYQETPDQLAAINDVKNDMMSSRPMDRLICGDVGFGKTEVALRAAFKATQDNKQVMVLCPTTILAQQHYTNFSERFEPFGVHVEVLSRFRTPAQQREALAGFAQGSVQVLVGTHRLLSRDVNPHDLGLVIIDEEQRFGVGHKEQFKNLRESVDVLTLSATPIPRTMQMSMSGVRDMSLILTPPDDRRAVKVHVGAWDPDVVSAAIRYELARGGQVYYVSNRVRTIEDAVERVAFAAGEARIGVAHGKMSKDALEKVMEDFAAGELDVLVATTIIESGIDNPHTNTLIIEDSQRLGLAQMYQLKGRVGRSSVQAFAYFMYPEEVPLTEEAAARLLAINEHQELGSGMRIAMRDLEIRGAGDILGAEQSGNMSAVGFDLFAQMLGNAVALAKGGASGKGVADEKGEVALPPALSDITINLPVRAYFSDDYVPDVDERVLWYRRLASAASVEAVEDLRKDMLAKHAEMPDEARNMFDKAHVRAQAIEKGISNIMCTAGKITIEPYTVSREVGVALRRYGGKFLPDKKKVIVPLKYLEAQNYSTSGDQLLLAVQAFIEMNS